MSNDKIDSLRDILKRQGSDAGLLEDPIDLFYYCGISLSAGSFLVTPTEAVLFVDGRYIDIAKKKCSMEVLLKDRLKDCIVDRKISRIVFDSTKTCVDAFERKKRELSEIEWIPFPCLTKTLRVIKDGGEQEKMRYAATLSKNAFRYAVDGLKEGASEMEIAWRYEKFCREQGATKMAFEPIVAFGVNSAFPHHRASDKKLGKDEVILIDVGCVVNSYASDMTRTLVSSNAHPEIKKLNEIVRRAHQSALSRCRPGVQIKEVDLAAREEMRKEGLESLFVHSLGHGIGLETHEYPLISSKREDAAVVLEEGMVVTIEPGLYLPGFGGVRYEDTIILTKSGFENLYGDLP